MNREQLIEKTESAIQEAWNARARSDDRTYGLADVAARAALAVFEEANTPTDDEREALAAAWDEGMSYGVNYDAGIRPDPSRGPLDG
ncbi:hypothetical protein [Microbacterium sp. MYb64]|uniref:hypothetical protein n=1 Tax=Microbacterium sp. MYb64 TaxID=1848691 RepID=UPI000CFBB406|nr:hypothetical protein [Microbacterium sp. MYb64]PRB01775.1 hypothetical protein CQ044_16640 [Microbacterium sp. MYb64]